MSKPRNKAAELLPRRHKADVYSFSSKQQAPQSRFINSSKTLALALSTSAEINENEEIFDMPVFHPFASLLNPVPSTVACDFEVPPSPYISSHELAPMSEGVDEAILEDLRNSLRHAIRTNFDMSIHEFKAAVNGGSLSKFEPSVREMTNFLNGFDDTDPIFESVGN